MTSRKSGTRSSETCGDGFWTAAGLLLVLLAGYVPEATYQHLLILLGVAFLSRAMQWTALSSVRLNRPQPAPTGQHRSK